jgi:alkanesulfonate monooxygenase SsuD/methylene tetrahydromethanopterin reductase-like flavin-dependent oxidoreductase (luciferase family)
MRNSATGDSEAAQRNPTMVNRNRLKLGLFGLNLSHGLSATKVPERWDASWEHNVTVARMADEAGFECLVPVGRWKGYGGTTNFENDSFETITWAGGLLAHTRRITVFGTVHVPLIHPVLAAKQCVTADHIGHGRFGLNVVCGWNQSEFNMFGREQDPHDRRYDRGQEWIEIIRRIWSGEGPFDYQGDFYQLRGVIGAPQPWAGKRPIIMNAGGSPAGRRFAVRNSDLSFDQPMFIEDAPPRIAELKRMARELGNEVQVFTSAYVVCRPTRKEAEDYHHYFAVENAETEAVDRLIAMALGSSLSIQPEVVEKARVRFAGGYGAEEIIGSPDDVAAKLTRMAEIGFDGVVFNLVNFLDELPYFRDEVLPRLVKAGLRESHT